MDAMLADPMLPNLNDMVTFARVVEAGSFTEAARRMGASKSSISKTVARLEDALGVRLLQRSARGLSLTEIGVAFHEHCVRVADEAAQAAELASALQTEPRGVLKVTAPVAFGRLHVAPAAAEYLRLHPQVELDLTITDRVVDLVSEGHDLAVRITREPALHLVARELAPVRRVLCATPGYLARHGVPLTPDDLQAHNCLHDTHLGSWGQWRLRGADGGVAVVSVRGSLRVNDNDVLARAVLEGLGLALLPTYLVGADLHAGRLQAVLQQHVVPEQRIDAVHLPNPRLPMKVRAFVEFLQQRFGPVPPWDADAAPFPAGKP